MFPLVLVLAAFPDVHSLANPSVVRPTHEYPRGEGKADVLDLDTRELRIEEVTDVVDGQPLTFTLEAPVKLLGQRLHIGLPKRRPRQVRISYRTVPEATDLQLPGRVSVVALAAGLSLALQAEPAPRSVREIDFRSYLVRTRQLDDCRTLVPDTPLEPIHFLEVEYADLDHDGREEAVVEAASCAMGTGGCDIVEVLRLTGRGLETLRITDEGLERPPYEDRGMGSTPRLDVRGGQLIRWWVVNAKFPELPRSGWKRTLVYQWRHDRFVVDHVEEHPTASDPRRTRALTPDLPGPPLRPPRSPR